MPREIISPFEASRILSTERLKFVYADTEISHSEILYEVQGSIGSKLKCDICENPAKYIHHTRDHAGQNFIALVCLSCAPPGYARLSEQRSSG